MKKRLLSMLMAVLMIVSLVPGMALADTEYVVDIKADAAAKQPGIKVTETENGYDVDIKPFAKQADWCDEGKHVPVAKELIAASCEQKGLTVTYCSVCGTNLNKVVVTDKLHHDCEFKVVQAPTCDENGWGYAVCKKCGNPYAVDESTDFAAYVEQIKGELQAAYTKRVADVAELYKATGHDYKTVTADITHVDKKTGEVVTDAYAGVEATHGATVEGWTIGYKWTDGAYISGYAKNFDELYAAGKVVAISSQGVTAGTACAKCGAVGEAGGSKTAGLNNTHASALTITKGALPVQYDDGSYKDGKTDTIYCSICKKTFGGEVISAVKWFNITDEAKDPAFGTSKLWEGESDVYVFSNNQMIPATDLKIVSAATCCKEGYTGDTITWTQYDVTDNDGNAKGAWVVTARGKDIDKVDHHFVALKDIPATCEDNGVHYVGMYKCDNVIGKDAKGNPIYCKETKTDVVNNKENTIVAKGHNPVEVVLVEATCQHAGLNVLQCSVCNKYLDKTTYATAAKDSVPAYTVAKSAKHVAADELANVAEATCTEAGYTGDKVCKWCGEVIEKGKEIPAKGHTPVDVEAVAATCTEAGATAGTKCSVCGEILSGCEKIDALGHEYKDGVCVRCGAKEPVVAPEFKDAAAIADYAKDAVKWAAEEGAVKGDTAGNFNPAADITRQDFVTMLWRLNGEAASEKEVTFGDSASIADYAAKAVAWAVEKGYVVGDNAGNFNPTANITRAEIATILNRIAGNVKAEKAATFTDVDGHWAADAIAWAAEAGVVKGVGGDLFAPDANATRQDTVVMLYRFAQLGK